MTHSSTFLHVLLSNLKSIVELISKFPGDSLTSQYGALERTRSSILAILTHGFRLTTGDFHERLWHFVLALTASSANYIQLLQDIYQEDNFRATIEQWIDQSVIRQCLAEQFSALEDNEDVLENYYHTHAFLRVKAFYQAFLICIRTIESSDPTLLTTIDPKLSIVGVNGTRSLINDVTSRSYSSTTPSTNSISSENPCPPPLDPVNQQRFFHRRNHSDPIFHFDNKSILSSETSSSILPSNPLDENLSNLTYSIEYGSSADSHSESYLSIEQQSTLSESTPQIQSNPPTLVDSDDQQMNQTNQPAISPEAKAKTLPTRLPYSSLFWPRKEQTLDNYLRECDSQTRTDVEKENAHFYFSEAVLAAIEYIRFSQKCQQYFDPIEEKVLTLNEFQREENINSDSTTAEHIALAIMDRWKTHRIPTAADLFWMLPRVDEPIDEQKGQIDLNDDSTSSETTERVRRRGNNQWAPPREQLIFIIHPPSSRDVQLKKQDYLCAGCGRAVEKAYASRYRYCEYTGKYFCRSCHSEKRFYLPSYLINKWEFSNRHSVSNFAYDFLIRIYSQATFNLSDLNPKLFERSNKLRIVNELRWALFSLRYYIFTCRFAEEKGCQKSLLQLPSYVYENPDLYSMEDMIRTKSRELQKLLEPIVNSLREHVLTCLDLCYAKGFICEICQNEKSIIFPFDIQVTSVCSVCQACFHVQCYRNQKFACPKCQRTRHRNSISSINRAHPPINS